MASDRFPISRKVQLTSGLKRDLTEAMDSYANSRDGHPHRDLGRKSTITVVSAQYSYRFIRETLVDARSIKTEEVPFRIGDKCKPADEAARASFDIWKYDFKGAAEMKDGEDLIDLESILGAYVCTCGTCGGRGSWTCSECGGYGRVICPRCKGSRRLYVRCDECDGYGQVEVLIHDGTGVGESRWVDCPKCDGRRQVLITCPRCGLDGRLRCDVCGGTGIYVCRHCDGAKEVKQIPYLESTRKVFRRAGKSEPDIPKNIGLKIQEREGMKVFDSSVPFSTPTPVEGADEINRQYQHWTFEIGGNLNSGRRATSNRLTVYSCEFYLFDYTYNNVQYYGYCKDRAFFPVTSPIAEFSSKLIDKTDAKLRQWSIKDARKTIHEASRLNVATNAEKVQRRLDAIENYFGSYYNFGLSVMFWVAMLLLMPFNFFYYSEFNPVLPFAVVQNVPDSWLYSMTPLVQTIVYIAILLAGKQYFKENGKAHYESHVSNFLLGNSHMLLVSLCGLVALALINFLGIGLVGDFVGGAALTVIGLILGIILWLASIAIGIVGWIFILIGKLWHTIFG